MNISIEDKGKNSQVFNFKKRQMSAWVAGYMKMFKALYVAQSGYYYLF